MKLLSLLVIQYAVLFHNQSPKILQCWVCLLFLTVDSTAQVDRLLSSAVATGSSCEDSFHFNGRDATATEVVETSDTALEAGVSDLSSVSASDSAGILHLVLE